MAVQDFHPAYAEYDVLWERMEHCYGGEHVVKAQGTKYLPATEGMYLDGLGKTGTKGQRNYDAYVARATFSSHVTDSVDRVLGTMHSAEPSFTLPPAMAPLLERATRDGMTLEGLLQYVNFQQIKLGRIGLLFDLEKRGTQQYPIITTYNAPAVRNWVVRDDIQDTYATYAVVVLDESGPVFDPDDYRWKDETQYRVLAMTSEGRADIDGAVYSSAVLKPGDNIAGVDFGDPPVYFGQALNGIPFVVINRHTTLPVPDLPPYLGLANRCLAMYRGDADYRQYIHEQVQNTFVTVGAGKSKDQEIRVGAGAHIDLPIGGNAFYVGIDGSSLSGMREAQQDDLRIADKASSQLIDTSSTSGESGEALKIRLRSNTTSLYQLARTGADGLQQLLRIAAPWFGADPEAIEVTPNLDFIDEDTNTQDLINLVQAKTSGLPISWEEVHQWAFEHGVTRKTFEETMQLIAQEPPELGLPVGAVINTGVPGAVAVPTPADGDDDDDDEDDDG